MKPLLVSTALCLVLAAPAARAQDAAWVTSAQGVLDASGTPWLHARVQGGTPPFTVTARLARDPGQAATPVPMMPVEGAAAGTFGVEAPAWSHGVACWVVIRVLDATGAAAEWGSTLAPEQVTIPASKATPVPPAPATTTPPKVPVGADGPPIPDAPPVPPELPPASPGWTPVAPDTDAAPEAEPPHPAWNPDDPDEGGASGATRAAAKKAGRGGTSPEFLGMPVGRSGITGTVLLIITAAALLAAFTTAAGTVLFLIDLTQAQRMVLAVDRAQARGDPRPDKCAGGWGACRDPYLRAFYMDAVMAAGLGITTLLLVTAAVGLFLAATLSRWF